MSLNDTPNSNRVHIGFFGKCNSGKSSLINAFTGQSVAIVSEVSGTTADPVYKAMEIHGIGPCVLIDTAGFDDTDIIGSLRVEKTEQAAKKADVAVLLFSGSDISDELEWYEKFKKAGIPVLCVISKTDIISNVDVLRKSVQDATEKSPVMVNISDKASLDIFREKLIKSVPDDCEQASLAAYLTKPSDVVLLVMPQDIQAPKGRLILPQVQVIRDLLDGKCVVVSTTADTLCTALSALKNPPKLIITDSQVFAQVYKMKPEQSLLTSFSVLMAGYKGDIEYFVEGAAAIEALNENSRVLIAECCTHAPLIEDIGREKLPRLLRKKAGNGLKIDMVSGSDFPADLSGYDIVIQCGACMFNRRYVMSRVNTAKTQKVPMTNYGVAIAYINGILDKITY